MSLEGGLEKLKENVGSTFDRFYPECGIPLPDIPINDFLRANEEACGLKPNYGPLGFGSKTFRDYCFEMTSPAHNGNIQKKELYKALEKYTKTRINSFRDKERHKEEYGISREDLIREKKEILPFVRAREALKDYKRRKKFIKTAKE